MNRLKINIKGKRIESFLSRLLKLNIELYNIEYISYQEINIIIDKKDYGRIKKIKTSYKIKIINKYGLIKIKEQALKNKFIIIFILIGIILLFFLSNIIFSIKVIHNDEDLRNLIYQELNEHGIKIHHFKKERKELENIKEKILEEHKDKIEWLEIEEIGTSYIIRVEARIIPKLEDTKENRDIIARKNAVIRKIEAKNGSIIRQRGEYINKGDIIISGSIKLNDNVMGLTHAEGVVLGEVWYTLDITYPYVYQEDKLTNEKTTNIEFNLLSNRFNLLGKKYKYRKTIKEYKITSTILPINITISKNRKLNKIDYVLTCDQAINKATEKGTAQINESLKNNEYILNSKILETNCSITGASIKVFYAVLEDITDYQVIN